MVASGRDSSNASATFKVVLSIGIGVLVAIVGLWVVGTVRNPQTVSITVVDPNGTPLEDVTVQGFIVSPSGVFTQVFLGTTNLYGTFATTNLSVADSVMNAWAHTEGSAQIGYSYPDIILFLTYTNRSGQYFQESHLSLTPGQLFAGQSVSTTAVLSSKPLDLPTPGCAMSCEWIGKKVDGPYPSSPGPIGTIWATFAGDAYGAVAESIQSTSSTNFNMGLAIGALFSHGASVTDEAGTAIWTVSSEAQMGTSSGTIYPGQTNYQYIDAQVEGELFQEYSYTPYLCAHEGIDCPQPTNIYQYDVGIINIQINNGAIAWGYANTLPGWTSNISYNYTYTNVNDSTVGNGGGFSAQRELYSWQLVNTFTSDDTTWIMVAVDVGGILADALSDGLAIPATMALSLVGTIQSNTVSDTQAAVIWNAADGAHIYVYAEIGDIYYQLGNGNDGRVPLMGIYVTATEGGGCVEPPNMCMG